MCWKTQVKCFLLNPKNFSMGVLIKFLSVTACWSCSFVHLSIFPPKLLLGFRNPYCFLADRNGDFWSV